MGKYQSEAKQLLELIGGKDNIVNVTHCATRLRFALVDDTKANINEIQKLPTVKGTFTNAGQFQVIIGNDVSDFSKDFVSVAGIQEATKEDVKKAATKNQPWLQRMVAHLAEIFVPLIPALVAGGLLLGFRNVLENPLTSFGYDKPLQDMYGWAKTLAGFTGWISLAVFAYLPTLVAWSTVKKFGGTIILGIVFGLMLVYHWDFMNAYDFGALRSAGVDINRIINDGSEKYSIDNYNEFTKQYPDIDKRIMDKYKADTIKNSDKKVEKVTQVDVLNYAFGEIVKGKSYAESKDPVGLLLKSFGIKDKIKVDGKEKENPEYKQIRNELIEIKTAAEKNVAAGKHLWNIFGYKVQLIGYQAQVLPALFGALLLVYIERFVNKRTPEVLKLVVVPFVSLVLAGLLTILFVGPAARAIGDGLTGFFTFMFTTPGLKYIGAILFGGLYAPLVITGLHHTFIAVDLQLAASGGTFIWPMIAISNISQAGAALATYFLYKSEKQKSVSSSATISAWFGITEPAMFGANLKFMYPMIAAIIGSICGALICTVFGVKAVSIGVGGLALAWMSIFSQYLIPFVFASIVATVVPFILTYVFAKTKLNKGSLTEE